MGMKDENGKLANRIYLMTALVTLLIGWKINPYLAVGFIWTIVILFEIFKH
jgi:hypothetical protein